MVVPTTNTSRYVVVRLRHMSKISCANCLIVRAGLRSSISFIHSMGTNMTAVRANRR
jgi:hypothetical protein